MNWSKTKCPICHQPLTLTAKSLVCNARHTYDLSKEGYANLLIANQKKSRNPGDNKLMIDARRAFLELGEYDFLIKKIATFLEDSISIFDAGCGEGYYLDKLSSGKGYGMDISKSAIKIAAKKYKHLHFIVGSVYQIPVLDESFDTIISIFSPTHFKEFHRILNAQGKVILVTAAPNHMQSIAAIIYDKFKPHSQKTSFDFDKGFELIHDEIITKTLHLTSNETILNLLKMTPYYWNTVPEKLEKFTQLKTLDVEAGFRIRVFTRASLQLH